MIRDFALSDVTLFWSVDKTENRKWILSGSDSQPRGIHVFEEGNEKNAEIIPKRVIKIYAKKAYMDIAEDGQASTHAPHSEHSSFFATTAMPSFSARTPVGH